MKVIKGLFLYFICPMLLVAAGFCAGILSIDYFYPGRTDESTQEQTIEAKQEKTNQQTEESSQLTENVNSGEMAAPAQAFADTLCADTLYVLEETDVIRETAVETSWRLPAKYIGMNREQFLTAMEVYEAAPPLSEMERGFVSLEVLSFSRERVVVQMNYQYIQPGNSFYLAVMDNEVVVLLEDMQTIYINTGILLDSLPERVQQEIIQMLWIEDEESLYDFLESYSS